MMTTVKCPLCRLPFTFLSELECHAISDHGWRPRSRTAQPDDGLAADAEPTASRRPTGAAG